MIPQEQIDFSKTFTIFQYCMCYLFSNISKKQRFFYFTSNKQQSLKFVFQNIFDFEKAQNDPPKIFFPKLFIHPSLSKTFEKNFTHLSILPYNSQKGLNSAMKIICIATLEEKLLQLNGQLFKKRIVDSRMYCSALNHSYITALLARS